MKPHSIRMGCCICTPIPFIKNRIGQLVKAPVSVDFHRARSKLGIPTNFNLTEIYADGMEVGEARTQVAKECLKSDLRPEFLFFLDWDVVPSWDALQKLIYRARHYPDHDIFAGVYCVKFSQFPDPLIYDAFGEGPYWDWAVGDILTTEQHGICGVHMGLTLIRVSLFQKMLDAGVVNDSTPFFRSTYEERQRGSEDLWFCRLAQKVGAKILIDTSLIAGHVDPASGTTYGLPPDSIPCKRAAWLTLHPGTKSADVTRAELEGVKLAIDLGAGDERRHWPGHITYTLDVRKAAGCDYCQDILHLNLPEKRYDLVASKFALEYVPRWEQQDAWQGIYKITKPGGRIEIVTGNLEWAAAKLMAGEPDDHVWDGIYGEQNGDLERWGSKQFGYTPGVAKGLAAQAGFKDIIVKTWKDDPNLGPALLLTALRPAEETVEETNGKPKEVVLEPAGVTKEVMLGVARQDVKHVGVD